MDGGDTVTFRISIPGKAYAAAIEDSDVPAQEEWPEPTFQKCGSGVRVFYEVDSYGAQLILTHLEDIAACFDDPENRADQRVLRQAVRSLYTQLSMATPVARPGAGM